MFSNVKKEVRNKQFWEQWKHFGKSLVSYFEEIPSYHRMIPLQVDTRLQDNICWISENSDVAFQNKPSSRINMVCYNVPDSGLDFGKFYYVLFQPLCIVKADH